MPAPPPRAPVPAQNLYVAAVAVLFGVSGGLLWTAGYNYDELAGGAATKLHPGTYLALLAFGVAALGAGNLVAFAVAAFRARPGSLFLLASAAAAFAAVALRSGPGLAGIVDTYMLPAVVGVLFATTDGRTRRRLELVVHAAMVCNAVHGLVEAGTRHAFFPYRLTAS